MKALFTEIEKIIEECEHMELDAALDRTDRSFIKEFYNGGDPIDPEDLEAIGLQNNENYLSGREVLSNSVEEFQSPHTKPLVTFIFELKNAPESMKDTWESRFTEGINKRLKDSHDYLRASLDIAASSVMFGTGTAYWKDTTNPFFKCLSLGDHLVPAGSPQDISEIPYDAYETTLTIEELIHYKNIAEQDEDSNWDAASLDKIINFILDSQMNESADAQAEYNPEKTERLRAGNMESDRFRRTEIDVWYFFQQRYDLPERPVEMRVILSDNFSGNTTDANDANGTRIRILDIDRQIYHNEYEFPSNYSRCIPVHLATNLTDNPEYHDVLGIGHLNYMIDVKIETFINRVVEHMDTGMRNLWVARDGSTPEDLEMFLAGHNSILPEGMELLDNRIAPAVEGGFSLINFMSQQRSGSSTTSNQGDPNTDKLQVQFQAEQISSANSTSNRLAKHNLYWAKIGMEIARRYTNTYIMPEDDGYAEVMEFQDWLNAEGIPIEYFSSTNLRCTLTKLPGDGNSTRQGQIYAHYQNNFDRYDPSKQQEVLKEMHYIATGDYNQAERMIGNADDNSKDQISKAMTENANMRVLGYAPPVSKEHIDTVHIPIHMKDMESLLQEMYETGELKIASDKAFMTEGAHVMEHINRMKLQGQAPKADKFLDALNKMSAVYDRVAKQSNSEAEEKQKQQQQNPEEQERQHKIFKDNMELQLKQMKQQLDFMKEENTTYKYERTQAHREQSQEEQLQLQRDQMEQNNSGNTENTEE